MKKTPFGLHLIALILLLSLVVVYKSNSGHSWFPKNGLTFLDSFSNPFTTQSLGVTKNSVNIENKITKKDLTPKEKHQVDSLLQAIDLLSFEFNGKNQLEEFFSQLSESNKELIRIWYYGDSQIEGDRITQDLRKLFQQKLGGSGMGYLPISNVATYYNLELGSQSDWKKFNCFQDRKKGVFLGFGGIGYAPKSADSNSFNYLNLKIFKDLKYEHLHLLGLSENTPTIEWKQKESDPWNRVFMIDNHGRFLFNAKIDPSPIYGKIQLRCKGYKLALHGFLLEGQSKGVQVDNLGIRGHSGNGLKEIPNEVLTESLKKLNTKLIVFHYGNNVVPYLKSDEGSKKWLMKTYREVFDKYRKIDPTGSFLLIGPGDMGRIKGGEEVPYESAAVLNGYMKELAKEYNMAYFDFYEFMQKDGGISGWKEKGWASLDGHLSPRGQLKFAKKLTSEIFDAYSIYLKLNSR